MRAGVESGSRNSIFMRQQRFEGVVGKPHDDGVDVGVG